MSDNSPPPSALYRALAARSFKRRHKQDSLRERYHFERCVSTLSRDQLRGRRWIRCTALKSAHPTVSMYAAAKLVAVCLFVGYVVRAIKTWYNLRQFGGHWSAGWSRLWMLRTQGSGEMNKRFTELNRQYGGLHRAHDDRRRTFVATKMALTLSQVRLLELHPSFW